VAAKILEESKFERKGTIMKKFLSLILASLMILSITACSSNTPATPAPSDTNNGSENSDSSKTVKFMSIGTAQLSGSTYNNGLAIATAANLGMTSAKVEALPTSGGVETGRMLRDGEIEIASLDGYVVYMLENGIEQYDGAGYDDIKLLFPLFTNYVNIIVKEDSPVQSMKDLKGLKVGVGNAGSIGYYVMNDILKAYGYAEGDIEPMALAADEQSSNMRDGMQDVFGYYTSQNSSAVVELTTYIDCRWLNVDEDVWTPYAEEKGLPYTVTVSSDTYTGIEDNVTMLTGTQWLVCRGDIDDEQIYEFVKAFFENYEAAEKMNATISNTKRLIENETFPGLAFAPGALQYYEEAGISVPQ
jgi:TRAP transporter TAXI family solute receptor